MYEQTDWTVLVWKTVACLRTYPGIGPVKALQAVAQSNAERALFTDLLLVNHQDELEQFLAEVRRKAQTQTYHDQLISGAIAAA